MTSTCERLATYTAQATWDGVSPEARGKLRQHVLDTLGCAIGAVKSADAGLLALHTAGAETAGLCSLIGGGAGTPEQAAYFNTALIGLLDVADTFIAAGEFCQPADNLGALLAAAEFADATGRQLLTALAISYHVQCRLSASGVGFTAQGYDGTLPLSVSLACGIGHVFGLTEQQIAHAIALCAASGLTLRGSDAGESTPKSRSLSAALCAFRCMQNVRLAQKGVTGPLRIFDGRGGLEQLLGRPFGIDWESEDLDGILACSIKKFTSAFYAQSAIEAVLEMRREHSLDPKQVHGIQIDIFQTAYEALAGGNTLAGRPVKSVADAEQSLAYLASVALLDGEVAPRQFDEERVQGEDVQGLLKKVTVWMSTAYTRDYPNSMKCKLRIGLKDGSIFELEKADYPGFFRRPMPVEQLLEKFKQLTSTSAPGPRLQQVIQAVAKLDSRPARELALTLRELGTAMPRPTVTAPANVETLAVASWHMPAVRSSRDSGAVIFSK
jgi:2-methylcitrate dehydratase